MTCSDARLAANRRNASRSTGPTSDLGKTISRQNSWKHGLTGQGVVVAGDDAAEIERRVEALEADMRPASPGGALLIRQMAVSSVRIDRAAARENAAIARRVRHAAEDHDAARVEEAERLFEQLADEPRRTLRKLVKTPEGVECLLDAWRDLRDVLAGDPEADWTAAHLERASTLAGKRKEAARGGDLAMLSRALRGDFAALDEQDGAGLSDPGRREWARKQLATRIDDEIAILEDHRATLDLDAIERDRAEAGTLALFDPGQEATLARRYEAEAHRRFHNALKEFRRVEAESAAKADAEASPSTPAPEPVPSPRMGSSGDRAPEPPRVPAGSSWDVEFPEVFLPLDADGQPLRGGQPPQTPG